MRPRMPMAITSSPFCSDSIMVLVSLAFLICGRMRMMGSIPIIVSCGEPPAAWARAVAIIGVRCCPGGAAKPAILSRGACSFDLAARGPFPEEALPPRPESPPGDGLAHGPHELQVVVQVVDGVQARPQDLVGAVQVVQVGAGEVAAGVAGAPRVERAGVLAVARILDLHVARAREEPAVAGVARGKD